MLMEFGFDDLRRCVSVKFCLGLPCVGGAEFYAHGLYLLDGLSVYGEFNLRLQLGLG